VSRALRLLFRGIATLCTTLAALSLLTFALSCASPIDATLQMVGDQASASSYAEQRHRLGLDAPWHRQFARYVVALVHGDLGVSRSTGQAVGEDLRRVFPATLELASIAMLFSTAIGLALGLAGAWRPRGALDAVVRCVSLIGNSLPIFWVGLLALLLFYARWHWAGGPGRIDDAYEYTMDMPTGSILWDAWRSHLPGALASALQHMVLPALVLALYAIGNITRLTRAALLGEAGKEYVTLARAKGCGELRIVTHHLLPNVVGLLLTTLALTYTNLLEGAVLVETVFARPGLGRYLTTALFAADTPAIVGGTLLIGVCFVLINGATDLAVRMMDPRVS
jgi:peptide/nickel transport system permease protein